MQCFMTAAQRRVNFYIAVSNFYQTIPMADEIATYKEQLLLVQQQLATSCNEEEKASLIELEKEINELIRLTTTANEDDLDQQYELFKAELAADEAPSEICDESVEDDLNSLEGMKCQAPFKHSWTEQPVYHNALVFKVNRVENVDVTVTVMFTHPTHKEMLPCPYFLEGECRFTEEDCRYSHGQLVTLDDLREFKDPEFSKLSTGSRVLFKEVSTGLWAAARIVEICDEKCIIQQELSSKKIEVELGLIFPMDTDANIDDDGADSESDGNDAGEAINLLHVLNQMPKDSVLGGWQEFTKGFGSRMMAKMGYVHGSGLGTNGEGRVEPVPAVIYPPGKSLDHCMMLKERTGDENMFKAERKMKRLQQKRKEADERAYEREKQRSDVFSFLNKKLSKTVDRTPAAPSSSQNHLKDQSKKGLNVTSLQISENVTKIEKEKKKLAEALKRHATGSAVYNSIKGKIKSCDDQLQGLDASSRSISRELKQREDRRKLTIF